MTPPKTTIGTQLNTPDLTPAQVLSALAVIGTEAVDAAWISGQTEQILVGVAGIVVPLGFMLADAIIRHGRATALSLKRNK